MKIPPRSTRSRALARVPAGRAGIRGQTHRINVPRGSQRPVERSGQPRRGRRP